LTVREYECARHVVSEIQRVWRANERCATMIIANSANTCSRPRKFPRLSEKTAPPNWTRWWNWRARIPDVSAPGLPAAALAAATINLVAYHQAESFMQQMSDAYEDRTGHKLQPILCQIVDGAG